MTSKLTITDERLAELVAFKPLPGTDINSATRDEWMAMAAELHERRKADSEPVAWEYEEYVYVSGLGHLWREKLDCEFPGIECGTLRGVVPLYRHAQQPVVPNESYQQLSDLYHAQEKRLFKIAQRIKGPAFDKYSHSPSQAIDVLEAAIFGEDDASCAAMLQAGNSPVIPEGWQVEAERLAEMHGMSFVLFRHGEAPQCADPTKVVISFTDKGLGHDTLPAAPQELK
ncbi:TPA: hypothetical protein OME29_000658 [Klebsiella oxytoca]|nr:hypothetical protein [Klebsiella oxytoca]